MTSAPPTPPIKVAFIGLSTQGWASTTLAPSLTHPSLRSTYSLVAVSTTSPSSALQTAEKWSRELGHEVRAFHGDVESNLLRGAADTHWENESDNVKSDDDESKNDDSDNKLNNNNNAGKLPFDFDLAVISIRPLSHQPTLLPIIRSKKDFFIEWPVGRNSSETREIAAEAQRYGVRSIVGLQGRLGWAVNKAKEIIESGKIGKILSTNVVALCPRELHLFGPEAKASLREYLENKENGANVLTGPIGHHLDTLTYLLGPFTQISATSTTHYPTSSLVDDEGNPTGETITTPGDDHIAITGLLSTGTLASILWRAGQKAGTPGRTAFLWSIDGEDGTIELRGKEGVVTGAFINISEPELFVNGDKVDVDGYADEGVDKDWAGKRELGPLAPLIRGWEEFAKGEEGKHATIEDAVRVKRLVDAIEESLSTGKRITV